MKKFGKLRQWTDEKLGASQKTLATEEFRDMEAEMQTRQQGLESVRNASMVWMRALGKKKEGQDKEKGIPLELLGIALFQHGEDFASDSAYGQALTRFGIAQQKIARAQEAFQGRINEHVLTSMERSLAAMKEYQNARKKLESRRLTYDAALGKVQKAKKEDSKLEEELRAAKARYDEISDDVHHRMVAIREAEAMNLDDIADFIDAETDYFENARELMVQLKTTFHSEIGRREKPRQRNVSNADTARREENAAPPRRIASQTNLGTPASSAGDLSDPFYSRPNLSSAHVMLGSTSRTMSQQSLSYKAESESSEDHESASKAPPMRRSHTSPPSESALPNIRRVKANFAFEAEAETEMTIRPGEIIAVLEEISSGWWEGQIVDDQNNLTARKGLFPANYCSSYVPPEKPRASVAPRPPTQRIETMTPIEDETTSSPYKAQTYPRLSRQANHSTDSFGTASVRGRPPPPPIPKKKQPGSVPPSPGRFSSPAQIRS